MAIPTLGHGQLGWQNGAAQYILSWDHTPEQANPPGVYGSVDFSLADGSNRVAYVIEFIPKGTSKTIRFPNGKVELEVDVPSQEANGLYFAIASGYDVDSPHPGKKKVAGGLSYTLLALRPPATYTEDGVELNGELGFDMKLKFYHGGKPDHRDICFINAAGRWADVEGQSFVSGKPNVVENIAELKTKLLGTYAMMEDEASSLGEVHALTKQILAKLETIAKHGG